MGTRAVVTFIDNDSEYHVYKHWDGHPDGILQNIEAAKPFAWELPRFEADEFAAAFIAANKDKGGGDIRITDHYKNHGDLEFRYEVRCVGGELQVGIFVPMFGKGFEITNWVRYAPDDEEQEVA